ncbi:aldehyde dehydrogenase family protein [Halomarina pelagica]|uniref:aldehyde dehydrogenase family protein n=1 Tax=Halomarina pelagica TaxID=2961599 RepID=UPI0020C5A648|nr:aldehyde dehydrogenase family protein [Halomarina sp. BND7]
MFRWDDYDEMVRVVNDVEYGLATAVITDDTTSAIATARTDVRRIVTPRSPRKTSSQELYRDFVLENVTCLYWGSPYRIRGVNPLPNESLQIR